MAKSTKSHRKNKSPQDAKPYPEFPLTAHPSGRWCKKRKGKQHYFGPLVDWNAALERYKREWPYILDGREHPPVDAENGCTLAALCNSFLNAKRRAVDAGELSPRSWEDYHKTTDTLIAQFGRQRRVDDLRSDDFGKLRAKWANRLGVVSLRNEVNRARVVFKFAADQRLIERPVHFGQSFDRPSAKMLRKARNEAGPKMFTAEEIRRILGEADPTLKAMIFLGCNCGFGNTDIASLPQAVVDLDAGWIEFPRPKTEIPRRCPLWTETVGALRAAIELRPKAKDKGDDGLCFLTIHGRRWVRVQPSKSEADRMAQIDALSQRFARSLRRLNINDGQTRIKTTRADSSKPAHHIVWPWVDDGLAQSLGVDWWSRFLVNRRR